MRRKKMSTGQLYHWVQTYAYVILSFMHKAATRVPVPVVWYIHVLGMVLFFGIALGIRCIQSYWYIIYGPESRVQSVRMFLGIRQRCVSRRMYEVPGTRYCTKYELLTHDDMIDVTVLL